MRRLFSRPWLQPALMGIVGGLFLYWGLIGRGPLNYVAALIMGYFAVRFLSTTWLIRELGPERRAVPSSDRPGRRADRGIRCDHRNTSVARTRFGLRDGPGVGFRRAPR